MNIRWWETCFVQHPLVPVPLPYEGAVPLISGGSAPIRSLNLPAPWSWTIPTPKLWEPNFCSLSGYEVLGSKWSVSLSFWWLAGDPWHPWAGRKLPPLSFYLLIVLSLCEQVVGQGQNSQFLMLNGIWLESDVRYWDGRIWSQLGRSHGRRFKNG